MCHPRRHVPRLKRAGTHGRASAIGWSISVAGRPSRLGPSFAAGSNGTGYFHSLMRGIPRRSHWIGRTASLALLPTVASGRENRGLDIAAREANERSQRTLLVDSPATLIGQAHRSVATLVRAAS